MKKFHILFTEHIHASKKGTQMFNMPADNHHLVFSCQMRQTENFNFLHHRKICEQSSRSQNMKSPCADCTNSKDA